MVRLFSQSIFVYGLIALMPLHVFSRTQMGAISGVLFQHQGGRGIPAVRISLDRTVHSTWSDPDGRFAFPHVREGRYRIRIEKTGLDQHSVLSCDVISGRETELKISLMPDGTLNVSQDHSILPAGALTGSVLDEMGRPVSGAGVVVSGTDLTTTTDADGRYTIPNIAMGAYTVSAIIEGCPVTIVPDVMIVTGSERRLDIAQSSPAVRRTKDPRDAGHEGTIVGIVSDGMTGMPVTGAVVSLPGLKESVTSDNEGFFRLRDIPAACHQMEIIATGLTSAKVPSVVALPYHVTHLSVRLYSSEKSEYDMSYSPWEPGMVDIRVTDASTGLPVDYATICHCDSLPCASTDPSGRAIFSELEPGRHCFHVVVEGYLPDTIRNVPVYEGKTSHAQMRLRVPVVAKGVRRHGIRTVSGLVTDAANGRPVAAARITSTEGLNETVSDTTGAFRLDSLPHSSVVLSIRHPSFRTAVIKVPDDADSSRSVPAALYRGSPAQVSLAATESPGALTGKAIDASGSAPVPAAQVTLSGLPVAAVTLESGEFLFAPLPAGIYSLTVSREGFADAIMTGIEVGPGDTATVTLPMKKETVTDLFRVAVSAAAQRNTEASLLRERKLSFTVSDGISAAEISRAGAGNVAAAVKQIPGVTVLDGKYIVVRGLSERYVSTTLNGMVLPSPDPDKRAVPLDMFPTALIDNIKTNKAFTADKPGNFAGGNVDIITKAIPEKFVFTTSVSGRADNNFFSGKNQLDYEGGKLDWLGIDDGTRALPAIFENLEEFPTITRSQRNRQNALLLDSASKALSSSFLPESTATKPDFGFGVTTGNSINLDGHKFGGLFSGTYSNSKSSYTDGINSRFMYREITADKAFESLALKRAYTENRTKTDILWGGLASATYEYAGNQSVNANYMYVHNAEDEIRKSLATYIENLDPGRVVDFYGFGYSERNLSMFQLTGSHNLPFGFDLGWGYSRSSTKQDQPEQRALMVGRNTTADTTGNLRYSAHENNFPVKNPQKNYLTLDETGVQAKAHVSYYPFGTSSKNTFIRAGVDTLSKTRSYRADIYYYTLGSTRTGAKTIDISGGPAQYFSPDNVGIVGTAPYRDDSTYFFGLVVNEGVSDIVNYDAFRKTMAFYVMGAYEPFGWLNMTGGLRREKTRSWLENFKGDGMDTVYTDLLPSAGCTFSLPGDMKVRLMYGKTIAQPSERELAPFTSLDLSENVELEGNPKLIQTGIDNYDVRWEWFQHTSDLLAVSLFYKHIKQPIEKNIVDNNGNIKYDNVEKAEVRGIELESRFSFSRIAQSLNGLSMGGNLSLIDSRLTMPAKEFEERKSLDPDAKPVRPLQGQSPWVVNLYLGYSGESSGITASTTFHLQGPTIQAVSQGDAPDVYSKPHPAVSISLGKKITRNFSVESGIRDVFGDTKKAVSLYNNVEHVNIQQIRQPKYSVRLSYTF